MLGCKKQPYNSVWVWADSQEELGLTFMRFQEFYESPNPEFRNNIFTLGQLKRWYSKIYGANNYHSTWVGFNFPSKVLTPFKEGLFDPLTTEEERLLDLFKYRDDEFYIIGAQNNSVLRHELAHALYSTNPKYKKEIDNFLNKHKTKLKKTLKYIKDKGYNTEVLYDEIQVLAGVNKIFNKYNVEKVKK